MAAPDSVAVVHVEASDLDDAWSTWRYGRDDFELARRISDVASSGRERRGMNAPTERRLTVTDLAGVPDGAHPHANLRARRVGRDPRRD